VCTKPNNEKMKKSTNKGNEDITGWNIDYSGGQ